MNGANLNEQTASQLPALHLLQNLGYAYLTPQEAQSQRGGRLRNILLEGILTDWLRANNRIQYKGREIPFSEGNIQSAVEGLKSVYTDNLIRTNEQVYDRLTLGASLQQAIEGDLRSFSLNYVDWEKPENNVYHVTEEFPVERAASAQTRRPDIVLFVNGIPLAVIECKSPDIKDPMRETISQHIRNQKADEIPHLFYFGQLLLGVCSNEARYATVGTAAKFWSAWTEKGISKEEAARFEQEAQAAINRPLGEKQIEKMIAGSENMRYRIPALRELNAERKLSAQDRAIYALCRPARLLALTKRYILFDGPDKKIARYQQFFAVEKIIRRIASLDRDGRRTGGVVWHTQGSGKSLTMVFLARAIAMAEGLEDYKIVLVTDRVDLDDQIKKNFIQTGQEVVQAATGNDLAELLRSPKSRIISTVINKFEAAVARGKAKIESPNIFVLVDEGHRTQYGSFHGRMKQVLPNACYIGFTGTPVAKKDKDTVTKFGGMIDTYTITEAVDDEAVVPLLYEGRHVHQRVDKEAMDKWFERETRQVSEQQAAYLKTMFASTDQLNKAAQKVREIAWDISQHFREHWQGTPFKGQLVAPDKATALLYKQFLDDIGIVSAEVLISGPDEREGETDIHEENSQPVQRFWKVMMDRYGSEREYNKQLINAFKHGDEPEIIIVVDKLLTGFDAPRNTVLYLTRSLRDHTLLQAIARVNRLYEGKQYGYIIDYYGVLANLSDALELYEKLDDFDTEDLKDLLTDISVPIRDLPQKHSVLWDTFKEVKNRQDVEEFEQSLSDPESRDKFYARLTEYSNVLAIALSSARYLDETPPDEQERYKRDLKFFTKLRSSVKRRFAETLDFSEYQPRIQKLLDTHVSTEETERITELVNIFEKEAFAQEVARLESPSAKADTIAHRTSRTIYERMGDDPVFYARFSELLQKTIDDYRQRRIDENAYLARVTEIMEAVVNRTGDDIPSALEGKEVAKAYYGVIGQALEAGSVDELTEEDRIKIAVAVDEIVDRNRIVQWADNQDVQNKMRNEIEDWLFEYASQHEMTLDFEVVDEILEQCIAIAKRRKADAD
ncbi:MAG: type I restriction endonuclease subunit R [Anaerolineae bacterium]|nr:MAG: type I restriction endonuclease subunit R [Anaerolineae bacterium]